MKRFQSGGLYWASAEQPYEAHLGHCWLALPANPPAACLRERHVTWRTAEHLCHSARKGAEAGFLILLLASLAAALRPHASPEHVEVSLPCQSLQKAVLQAEQPPAHSSGVALTGQGLPDQALSCLALVAHVPQP